jgi:two-component system sensor histidine kinase DesK
VAGYRQPDLASELAAARQLLTAAGVGATISSPQPPGLPAAVDAVLAWTVREGVTNIVRHAGATAATITVAVGRTSVVTEITDNGPGGAPDLTAPDLTAPDLTAPDLTLRRAAADPGSGVTPAPAMPRLRRTGSGLAGLAERVRDLGGDLAAGQVSPRGFRLRVTIPVD